MLPKWAYGFWQSRERYKTQAEIVDAVREYRRRKIPLDNIVLDWNYWPENAWGSHDFDKSRFPDPKKMVDDIHALNAQVMISVWPKFYPETANYQELDAKGFIYRKNVEEGFVDWIGKGYKNAFYDPYSPEARAIYWRQVHEKLNVLGFDAWWMDATEPDPHSNLDIQSLKDRNGPTAMGPADQFFNRMHSCTRLACTRAGARQTLTNANTSSRVRALPASSATHRRYGAATSCRAGPISTTRSPRR